MTKQEQELWAMFQEFDDFQKYVDLMEHRSNIAKDSHCPYCGYKTLEPISLTHSECKTCNKIIEI